MSGDLKGFLQVGFDVLATTVNATTKKILAQIGNAVGQTTDSDSVEWWQHVGFASRPTKPEPGKQAAQAVVLRKGDHDVCIASQDLRGLSLYGALDHGETCIYAAGVDGEAQARILLKKDGSINLFTSEGNTSSGASMGIFINTDGSINIAGPAGAAVLIGADGSIKLFNAGGAIQIAADGSMKIGSTVKISMASPNITVGATALPLVTQAGLTAVITAIAAAVGTIPASAPAGGTAAAAAIAATTALLASPPNVTQSFQAS